MDNAFIAVCMAAGGFILGTVVEQKGPLKMLCEKQNLVSETVHKDGRVECVYVRRVARTLKEIVNK